MNTQYFNGTNSALRDAFEWWYTTNYTEWIPRALDNYDEYGNSETQLAWKAYQHAHKAALNSLCVGADVTPKGAQIALMSKLGEITTVLASGYVEANRDGFVKVEFGNSPFLADAPKVLL